MLAILQKTLPFFAVIGYGAGRVRFFSAEATAYLTKFVFYFALSALLFGFAANLDRSAVFSWAFVWAYFLASGVGQAIVAGVAPQPVSTTILISTAVSVLTMTAVIAFVTG